MALMSQYFWQETVEIQAFTFTLYCVKVLYQVFQVPRENLSHSKTCVKQPPLKLTLVVDVERWLSYKGTCHVILLAKLHDMYLYKTDNFFHINHYLKSVSKVAFLHRFYCTSYATSEDRLAHLIRVFAMCVVDSQWF